MSYVSIKSNEYNAHARGEGMVDHFGEAVKKLVQEKLKSRGLKLHPRRANAAEANGVGKGAMPAGGGGVVGKRYFPDIFGQN